VTEKRRLGRGLEALLGGGTATEAAPTTDSEVVRVPLDQIETNPFQPRKDFDADELTALKASLTSQGLLQPVVARDTGHGYQLIAGERRLRAAKELGWSDIPVRVVDFNDQQVFEAALVENLQRADLNAIEKAQGFAEYMSRYGATHEDIARKIGMDRSTVTNLIRLLELAPSVQDAVRTGQISNGHARALLAFDDHQRQTAVCREIIARGLSVRAVEQLVKQERGDSENAPSSKPGASKTAHVRSIEDELRQKLATKVEIRLREKDKGQIVIAFESNDDFERVIAALSR
jgi:ParB family chromosome partitioning protein